MNCRLLSSYDEGFLAMIAGKKAPSLRARMEETPKKPDPVIVDVRGKSTARSLDLVGVSGGREVLRDS
jgi:hypothetical protein